MNLSMFGVFAFLIEQVISGVIYGVFLGDMWVLGGSFRVYFGYLWGFC